MKSLVVERKYMASKEKVWSAIGDFTRSPDPSQTFETEEQGDESNNGVGCVRRVKQGITEVRERLESADPPHGFTYIMLSGAPVKNYIAKVELTAEGNETLVRWSASFIPKIPGTGWLAKSMVIKTYNRFLDGIEKGL